MQTLADAIIQENIQQVQNILQYGDDVNRLDQYGYTPLIESAIMNNSDIAKVLLNFGAQVNGQDAIGSTALHWAADNENLELCELLLRHHADPNLFNISGQTPLVMPMLRQQSVLKKLLIQLGADETFAKDYINAKLLGHMFELTGSCNIVNVNRQFVQVDFEGFYLEFSIGLIADSLAQFNNHFAGKHLRRFASLAELVIQVLKRAAYLSRFQHYRADTEKNKSVINSIFDQEPLVLPIGYEGHAITFIKLGSTFIKCDRREDSRLYDNVMFYHMNEPTILTHDFMRQLIYKRQSHEMINDVLPQLLGLEPLTELKLAAQISGNCSWANVEACIPSMMLLAMMQLNSDSQKVPHFKSQALNFFEQWRDWNKDRALYFCIDSFHEADPIRKGCKAEILAAILFQLAQDPSLRNEQRIEAIMPILLQPNYEYILKNYIKVFYYESYGEKSKQFVAMLKKYGYDLKGRS